MAAEVRDIPFYKPAEPSPSPSKSFFHKVLKPSSPQVRVLTAQKEPTPVHFPQRLSSRNKAESHEDKETQSPRPSSNASTADSRAHSRDNSSSSNSQTTVSSAPTALQPLQQKGFEEDDHLEPLAEEDLDPGSFDLVAPPDVEHKKYSLETRSEQLFSAEHLHIIFSDPSLLMRFTNFLGSKRQSSVPLLVYYLDATKALKAIGYANAIAEALEPIDGFDFTSKIARTTTNVDLEEKAKEAFDAMVREDLPAYITHIYIQTVSLSIQKRLTGTLPSHLREASEGLAEVFCLTDPSRPDNPIVFASEEFHRTTQYGMPYVIGRNCRFLQGPSTSKHSVRRLKDAVEAGKEHYEVFMNYRRDGSPFMNLLMMAPLRDSKGTIRYFIGAQVDVSGLLKESSDLESFRRLMIQSDHEVDLKEKGDWPLQPEAKDEFIELSQMLNLQELDTVRKWGGSMHKESEERPGTSAKTTNWNTPRLLISDSPDGSKAFGPTTYISGKLAGVYENYLLVRPYPSLRILFASPSLRFPGILQSPFMDKIGGSVRVQDELTQALAGGRGVTARVRWVTKKDQEGRNRWIHCTPLLGSNGAVGVWMVVIVDDETNEKRYRMAPPVALTMSMPQGPKDNGSLRAGSFSDSGQRSVRSVHSSTSLRIE